MQIAGSLTYHTMFTKEQLAKWRSEGFTFDSFYDEVAVENPPENITGSNRTNYTINNEDDKIVCKCKVHKKANNFNELIALVKASEDMLIQNKMTNIEDRINCIRGIYYGTTWSLDYQQEKSEWRNRGFRIFTTFGVRNDARKLLKCSDNCKAHLFEALYESPEVIDSKKKVTDFGHLMIGLDARRSLVARYLNLPFGGSGLENVTWIGDLGGGAGMLAYKRVANPQLRAKKLVFDSDHDYGCSINIEGDISGYVVGVDEEDWDSISDPTDYIEDYIYKGLEKYFDDKKDWIKRVNYFIAMIGGVIEDGQLKNREDLLDDLVDSIEGFAQFYIIIRAKDKSMDELSLLKSFGYIKSCAEEVAKIFLDGLLDLRTHPNSYKFRAVTDPSPTPVDNSTIDEGMKKARKVIQEINQYLK